MANVFISDGLVKVNGKIDQRKRAKIRKGDVITFGNTKLKVLFTPGHSPASVSFYCEKDAFVIGGDVLFQGSIGRTDLPGGDYDTLMDSIFDNFLTLLFGILFGFKE